MAIYLGPVPRVVAPTREAFVRDWLEPQRPVVIEGAMNSWPAMKKWTTDYFADRFADREVPVAILDENNETRFRPVIRLTCREYFEAMSHENPKTRYYLVVGQIAGPEFELRGIVARNVFAELKDDIELPKVLDTPVHNVNLWCGYKGTTTQLHFDMGDNIHAVVSGSKRFTLFEPSELRNLYPYSIFQRENHTHYSRVNLRSPDLMRYPRFSKAKYLETTVRAGEMLFIPQAYWHHVRTEELSIAVNIWYTTPEISAGLLRRAPLLAARRILSGYVTSGRSAVDRLRGKTAS